MGGVLCQVVPQQVVLWGSESIYEFLWGAVSDGTDAHLKGDPSALRVALIF